ncbi:antibiotic biosynthesis monooxygenase [Xanthomonas campestris pv. badrii]|uniref:Antibiotic biosynthesis monooxygenase n=1 Tax=Xanthomonas campestris pv. badrii TaxID=149696 RepID=A0A7Z2ZI69_XANCA|nr:putative quinol monooxygenase [Xanthomonas campestris]MCC4603973.1 antibiotic biosynthesis monooxygenase [Xanthomonas campestris pv. parthenii]QJD69031.1 antibiotic biosynthesis monooxygenase [Xanthomonas campestris pv. badrii]
MIGMIVTLAIKPDSGEAFERAFGAQAAAVRANEPGNHLYELLRSRTRPDSYLLLEIYEDQAALASHRNASHMTHHRPLTAPFIAAEPTIEAFDVIRHPV